MDTRQQAEALSAKQYGVITARQAAACGMTADQVRQQVRSGRWTVAARGTYIVTGSPRTWEQRILAAVLITGTGAAASHQTAGWLQGMLEERPPRIDVTTAFGKHHGAADGFTIHRARGFGRPDIRSARGIPVTSPPRTLVDLAGVLADRPLAAALDAALLRGLISIPSLRRYIDRRGLRRRRGVGRLIKLLDDREYGVPESELEREFLDVVERFGLPRPVRQKQIAAYRADFAYTDARILIEVDGRATHGTAEAFEEDPFRQNALALEGWTILRFTWKRLTQQPEYVVETIEKALSVLRA